MKLHSAALAVAAVLCCGHAAGEQPPSSKRCAVAQADKEHLTVDCPTGRLVDLLAGIRDRTGVAFYVPPNLLTQPASVVLGKASLQAALDAALAEYDYTLDGTAVLAGGRAAGTKVTIFSMRGASGDTAHAPQAPNSDPPATAQRGYEPEPSAQTAEPAEPAPSAPSANELGNPTDEVAQAAELPPPVPEASSEQDAKVREAFFANLPAPDAASPMAANSAELPPAPVVTNDTGPGDGRPGQPLPEFTPGSETSAPPGIPR